MQWLRPLVWPLIIVTIASVIYVAKIQREMVDFDVYRRAAARALTAETLYRESDGHYQYKYFPAFAFAMAPFARLDPEAAKLIWFGLSVGLLSALVRWSVRGLPERRRTERALIWFTILFMGKFYVRELNLGQTNILLAVILVGALLSVQVDQPRLAGALVAIGVFVKPYAIILLPWLALSAGVPGIISALVVLTIGLLLPATVYGWTGNIGQIAAWYRTVTDTTAPNLLIPENVSFATTWAKWIGPGTAAARLAVATGIASLALAAVTMLRRRDVTDPAYLEFGQLMLLVPLLSPQGWDYVLLLATPAVIVLIDRFGEMSRGWKVFTMTSLLLMSFTIFDLIGRRLYVGLMAINIVSVAALGLIVSLAYLRSRKLA